MESTIEIRKYPNRRYYNTRASKHVTLEEIRDLVRDGHTIRVVDSRTDEDITVTVLTQILLEIESPKLAFFPSNFLQYLIRLNTDMFKNMTESYFNNSLATFLRSSDADRRETNPGFGMPFPGAMEEWQKMWLGMVPSSAASGSPGAKKGSEPDQESAGHIAELTRQIAEMRQALEKLQRRAKK